MLDVIILAGGLGTRLREVVPDLPKPLAAIGNSPFLDLLLERLYDEKIISNIVLAVGYKSECIINYYQKKKRPISFSIEKELLGTGGALLLALEKTSSNHLLVLNGDTFLEVSYEQFFQFHMEKKASLSLALIERSGDRYGEVAFDQEKKLLGFQEKGATTGQKWVSGGNYIIEKEKLQNYPKNKELSLERDIFPDFIGKGGFVYPTFGKFIDIGTKESYYEAQEYLLVK